MQTHKQTLDRSDRILWVAGNMHASKTSHYFSLHGPPLEHVDTSAMWLDEQYGLESIFTLPFSGFSNYQHHGKMALSEFKIQSPLFTTLNTFEGLQATASLHPLSEVFQKSYDWIYGLRQAKPSRYEHNNTL